MTLKRACFFLCIGCGLVMALFFSIIGDLGLFDPLEREITDHRLRKGVGMVGDPSKIVIVLLDDPMGLLDLLTRKIAESGASIIAFDTFFLEREDHRPISPFSFETETKILYPVRFMLKGGICGASRIIAPYTDLYKIQSKIYHTNLIPDRDGRVRRIYPFIEYDNTLFPSLPVLVAREYSGIEPFDPKSPSILKEGLLINYYRDKDPFKQIGLKEVFEGGMDLRGKIVLVGGKETVPTPIGEKSSCWIYATAIMNILNDDIIRSIPPWTLLLFTLLLGGVIGGVVGSTRPPIALILTTLLLGGYILITYMALLGMGIIMDLTTPLIAGVFSYLSPTILRYSIEERILSTSLKKARLYNQGVVECMNSGLLVLDGDGRVVTLNRRAQGIMGVEKAEGLLYQELLEEGRFKRIVEAALLSSTSTMDEEVRFRDRILLLSATPIKEGGRGIGAMAIFQDITEIKALEERMRFKERLAVIGELAAKVAHEFRNPIGSIRSSAKLLTKELEKSEYLRVILDECRNVETLIDEFLNFAGPLLLKKNRVALNVLVEDAIMAVLSDERGGGIVLKKALHKGQIEIEVDVAKMKRAIMNIAQNGVEAMDGEGTLWIKTEVGGGFVRIEITDTGKGIRDEDLKRVFEPFFTTKERGTGLGLAIARNIVEAHNGRIECRTEVGKGTTFSIYLPLEEEGCLLS